MNCLITEMPKIAALIACSTDGERATVDGFQKDATFAIFFKCFIHFKRTIEEHMKKCGFNAEVSSYFWKDANKRRN